MENWDSKFTNDLSTLIGVNGVTLSNVVRENNNPDSNEKFPNFIDNTISCVPLKGDYYEADHHTVHQTLVSFATVQPLEEWTKDTLRYMYGMISMK